MTRQSNRLRLPYGRGHPHVNEATATESFCAHPELATTVKRQTPPNWRREKQRSASSADLCSRLRHLRRLTGQSPQAVTLRTWRRPMKVPQCRQRHASHRKKGSSVRRRWTPPAQPGSKFDVSNLLRRVMSSNSPPASPSTSNSRQALSPS